ncbi:MAG: hypothetical protein FRX48_03643 [Lasallia pustulata]|uniref:Uncharacterized protein n=1 Tax=Lasallia pustulata TaxID=136370 RepID=A0A5M8PVF5_9LECA|nr:MAG: hypothetical protein FRX48_03643 [Lasallia pustulata]
MKAELSPVGTRHGIPWIRLGNSANKQRKKTFEGQLSELQKATMNEQTDIPTEVSVGEPIRRCDYGPQVTAFADTLIENFFLPLKASTGQSELDESKKIALAILNMFDDGVIHLIEGSDTQCN